MGINKNMVVVVIPVYKTCLNCFEQVALQQASIVLSKYPTVFVTGESIVFDYGKKYSNWRIERFSNKYFMDTAGYSALLLSEKFYERFNQYKFMLIYQLDAFVFSDQLEEFCSLDCDYIGAPVRGGEWDLLKCRVGNGGFSLRKISTTMRLLQDERRLLYNSEFSAIFLRGEDMFFSFCGANSSILYKVPSLRIAAKFSIELDIAHGYRNVFRHILPFGCHWWSKLNYHIWKPIIEMYGYKLPEIQDVNYKNTLKDDYRINLTYLFLRFLRKVEQNILAGTIFEERKHYSIWGAGDDGKRCLEYLKKLPIYIACVYDRAVTGELCGVPILRPFASNIVKKDTIIIIATSKYEDEIVMLLKQLGMCQNVDFLVKEVFYDKLLDEMQKSMNDTVLHCYQKWIR